MIILGSPGSGKSTIASAIAQKYTAQLVSCGDLYRMYHTDPRYSFLDEAKKLGKQNWIDSLKRFIMIALKDHIQALPSPKTVVVEGLWLDNLAEFQSQIGPISQTYYVQIKPATAKQRLLKRGRKDDHKRKIDQRVDRYFSAENELFKELEGLNYRVVDNNQTQDQALAQALSLF